MCEPDRTAATLFPHACSPGTSSLGTLPPQAIIDEYDSVPNQKVPKDRKHPSTLWLGIFFRWKLRTASLTPIKALVLTPHCGHHFKLASHWLLRTVPFTNSTSNVETWDSVFTPVPNLRGFPGVCPRSEGAVGRHRGFARRGGHCLVLHGAALRVLAAVQSHRLHRRQPR